MTKANTLGSLPGSFAAVAFSGSYSDLSGKPTNLSQFTNNVGFLTGITSTQVTTALGFTPETTANRNAVNGYAGLDSSGLVPSSLLPSYVDDVLEYANLAAFPGTGTAGKIFVALDSGKTYRWSGSAYVEISASPGSTDAVTEGATNLYFSNARARAAISATGSLSYNSSTGVLSYTAPTNVSAFTNDSGYITSSALSPYLLSTTAASTYQTQAGMSSYLTTASASSTYQTQSGMSSYLTTASAASTYQTALGFTPLNKAGDTITGNLAFSGTGLRITGDFSNATFANRTLFQTSTANGNTQIGLVPNGTAVNAAFFAYNNPDPTNASTAALRVNASETALISGITGTGTYLPMVFLTSNLERARIDTSGNFGIGTTSAFTKLHVYNATIAGGAPLATGSGADSNSLVRFGLSSVVYDFGAYANGDGWIQMRSASSYAVNYGIGINPNGGRVFFGGSVQEAKVALSGTAIDLVAGNYFSKTISGATSFTVSNVPAAGTAVCFVLDLTNAGSGAITWWTGVKWAGGTAPTLTAAGRDTLGFFTYDGGTTWTGLVLGKDVK